MNDLFTFVVSGMCKYSLANFNYLNCYLLINQLYILCPASAGQICKVLGVYGVVSSCRLSLSLDLLLLLYGSTQLLMK